MTAFKVLFRRQIVLTFICLAFSGAVLAQPAPEIASKTETPASLKNPDAPVVFLRVSKIETLLIEKHLLHCLSFAHQSYGYISWSMMASRRNLSEVLFDKHLLELQRFLEDTLSFADISIKLAPEHTRLVVVRQLLSELKSAVDLFVENAASKADSKEPGEELKKSGEIHQKVGEQLPLLYAEFEKEMFAASKQEPASATVQGE